MNKDERIAGLLRANNTMVEHNRILKRVIREAMTQFHFYQAEHTKKAEAFQEQMRSEHRVQPRMALYENANTNVTKAITNKAFADMLEAALKSA